MSFNLPRLTANIAAGALAAALAASVGCGEAKPSLTESLKTNADEKFAETKYKANPKPRPKGLPGPTEAEFKAWNRKDPEGEKHLYKWDKANVKKMLHYWEQLECFKEKVKEEGDKAFGKPPGSPDEEQWHQFKLFFVNHMDGWQKRLFAQEPRILEKSKFIGNFLEAHELAMNGFPKAYNNADKTALEENDAYWLVVEAKIKKYVKNLGGTWPERDPANEKHVAKHAEVCADALKPPDRSGKAKKRKKRKKTPI